MRPAFATTNGPRLRRLSSAAAEYYAFSAQGGESLRSISWRRFSSAARSPDQPSSFLRYWH